MPAGNPDELMRFPFEGGVGGVGRCMMLSFRWGPLLLTRVPSNIMQWDLIQCPTTMSSATRVWHAGKCYCQDPTSNPIMPLL